MPMYDIFANIGKKYKEKCKNIIHRPNLRYILLFFGRCLEKAKGSWSFYFFCIRKLKGYIFVSDVLNSRILISCSKKISEKSEVGHIT